MSANASANAHANASANANVNANTNANANADTNANANDNDNANDDASANANANVLTPRQMKIDFDELRRVLAKRGPRKTKFVKSRRCKMLVIIGVLLATGVIALMATTYAVAVTAASAKSKTTSTTASTLTTSNSNYQIITALNDPILGIYNATAGGLSLPSAAGNGTGNYPLGQGPDECIDFENTTYLNYGNVGYNPGAMINTAGVGTGVYTTPQVGASIVQAIQFQAGNDSANRDPLTITLEGSNATGTNLYFGIYWTLLYTGPTGLAPFSSTRLDWGEPQNFTNNQSFTSYRMIVTSQRGSDYCTEYAEMHLYGIV